MEIKDIILFILVILVIYLIYKTRKLENFSSSTLSADIITAVNDKYKIDTDALRNMASIASNILTNQNTLILPANTTTARDFTVSGKLTVTGNVNFINKNTNILEIFPKFMVMAWASNTKPLGWALCDGQKYSLNLSSVAVLDSNGIQTPDLRGRFILGAGFGSTDINNKPLRTRLLNEKGGEETHTLTIGEMPNHSHNIGQVCGGNCPGGSNIKFYGAVAPSEVSPEHKIGGNEPHENMPPFSVLYYIMKL